MDEKVKGIVDVYADAIVNHTKGYGEPAGEFVRKMLVEFGKRIIGELPDLEPLKDKKAFTDTDRLWYEAVWDLKRHQLEVLNDGASTPTQPGKGEK